MKPTSPKIARWGLLITTVALGVVLVGTGVAGFLASRNAARSLVRTRGLDLALSVQRSVLRSGGQPQAALDEVLEEMEEQGLRYVAVVTPNRGTILESGEPSAPLPSYRELPRPRGGEPHVSWVDGGRIRVVTHLIRPRRPHQWRGTQPRSRLWKRWARRRNQVDRGGRSQPGPANPWDELLGPQGDRRSKRPPPGARPLMVMEYEPVVASTITSRALAMLLISLAAATALLIAAIVFWRLSRRAEQMGEQLARDRQLKSLGEMSAVLGHELRNPLAALKGHAQLLVELLESDHPGRRGAETVVREALRMEALTGQILEFARTGAVDVLPESPEDVARSALEQTGEGEIELEVEEGIPPWPLDRDRIERVLVNLLRNAVQATEGEGLVRLKVARDRDGLVFAVRDNGPGIPPGEEEWIFEPFHTKRVRGTGLGLAVAQRIVEAHGGRITAENHPEGGSVFTVRLPKDYAVTSTS